jgi:flagellum-specific ATP synthase
MKQDLNSNFTTIFKSGVNRLRNVERMCRSLAEGGSSIRVFGKVISVETSGIQVSGLSQLCSLGDIVKIGNEKNQGLAETISIKAKETVVKPLGDGISIQLGMPVEYVGKLALRPSVDWLGRCISALAEPIDGLGPLTQGLSNIQIQSQALPAVDRSVVNEGVATGVRCIDVFTPICFGQRVGIFAGSGVGKSTLLAMMAQSRSFDVVIIALVGERGREVNEFIQDVLGDAMKKSVVVVATGDEAPGMRKMAPLMATRLAEFFRDGGKRVLLIMDSLTRYAMAAREIALAAGEPPVSRGYPPSVFSELPRLLERAGPGRGNSGSITGVYSVLVDGDNHNEPVADAVRGILDGHIVLDREIANAGRWPAVDILASISRLAGKAWPLSHAKLAGEARQLINRFESSKDLRLLGSYQPESDKELDHAINVVPKIYGYLTQHLNDEPEVDVFDSLARILRMQKNPQATANSRPTS